MPEPQDNPEQVQGVGEDLRALKPEHLAPAERALLQPEAVQTDDVPTIISKSAKARLRSEDTFAHGLRGKRLAHFELIEPIGVGGMAAVIRARDMQLDRQVALKILPPEMAADSENVRRFHQEARAAARLDHENIARVFYCGEDQGLHFIAFEFVEGENLRTMLERDGPLPVPEALPYLLQISLGLAHSSARGVVHRDIKPSNIIISSDGRVKLVDMGLARSMHVLGSGDLTQSGVTLGTFDYISPEQALEPRDADARSDIYSLGCTFYQLLTGQSPVPEGTAARKLHHHQHVPPLDPRLINPAIPDELAAILSRMMAKNADERYQEPLHLAKHLQDLAARLGLRTEGSESLHTIVVPPPQLTLPFHPIAMMGGAVLLLVIVVAAHAMLSTRAPFGRTPPASWTMESSGGLQPTRVGSALEDPAPPRAQETPAAADDAKPRPRKFAVKTFEQLATALRDSRNHADAVIEVAGQIDLIPPAGQPRSPGLVYDSPGQLTIQPLEEPPIGSRTAVAVFRLHHSRDGREREADGGTPTIGITVKNGKVLVKGIRFEIDSPEADAPIAALRVRDPGQLIVRGCEFIQANPAKERSSAILVDGPTTPSNEDRSQLEAVNCIFRRGRPAHSAAASAHDVFTLSGHSRVRLSSCAFGPHRALVRVTERALADVRWQQCSAFLLDGAAFWLEDRAAFSALVVENSIFSRPSDEPAPAGTVAALLKFPADAATDFPFAGNGNAYHNLTALCVRGEEKLTWVQFQRLRDVHDEQARIVSRWPWSQSKPLDDLDDNQPQLAFALEVDNADVRRGDEIIGIQAFTGPLYGNPLPRIEERNVNVRLVDPAQEPEGNRYKSVADAVSAARPGDTILIQHEGLLPIESVVEKNQLDVTLKSAEGFHPILTLKGAREADAVLFRIYDGEIRFEKLEFALRPRQRGFRETQSVVGVFGAGRCAFTDCVVTLDGGEAEVALAVVALGDPNKVMNTEAERPPARSGPEIVFTNCFIRGRGDCLKVPASRSFELKAANVVVALDGSFATIAGNATDPPLDPPARLTFEHVTSYVTGNLVQIRTNKNKSDLAPLRVAAAHCLFSSASAQPLIHFGGDIADDQLRNRLGWQGEHNAYSNFVNLLEQQLKNDDMMMGLSEPYKRARWETFTGETNSRFDPVRFAGTGAFEPGLAKAPPALFKATSEGGADADFGADLNKLPVPASDRGNAHSIRIVD